MCGQSGKIKIYRVLIYMEFRLKPIHNYSITDYDRCNRNYIYESSLSYYALTLTCPLFKKVIWKGKNKEFGKLCYTDQISFYKTFLDLNKIEYKIAFEEHIKGHWHAHILIYYGCDDFLDYIGQEYMKYLGIKTQKQLNDCFNYFAILSEIDYINWLNYMYKEHPEHTYLILPEFEEKLNNFNEIYSKNRLKSLFKIDINKDLDYI